MPTKNKIISQREAYQKQLRFFFTDKPCAQGHLTFRYTSSGTCVGCAKANYADGKPTRIFKKPKNVRLVPVTHLDAEFHVYAISAGCFIKIGVAQNIPARLMQIKVNCPHEPSVEWVSPKMIRPRAVGIERAALERFKTGRARGEWVRAHPNAVVSFLKDLAEG